jgi:hypothetical protein
MSLRNTSPRRNQCESLYLQAGFLLGTFFHPEDGSHMFHQNIG